LITNKLKYALKALVVLGEERAGAGQALRIEDIAQRGSIPKRFLEHILLELRDAGYLTSVRGRAGGYALAVEPRAIPLSEVVRLIDGPLAPLPCLSRRSYRKCEDCADETSCRVRAVFGQVFWSYLLLIESMTMADVLAAGDPIRTIISDIAPS
jgi:Rrf2 family protein